MAYITSASKLTGSISGAASRTAAFGAAWKAAVLAVLVLTTIGVTPAAADSSYVVRPGDTLSGIAQRYGVRADQLASANSISNLQQIRIGQKLTVPKRAAQAAPKATAAPKGTTYTVAPGDTLSRIAKAFGVSSKDLAARNGLSDPHRIRIGQKLRLPTGAAAVSVILRYPALPSRITGNPDRLALVPNFEHWASHYGVPADLLMAICYQESGWQSSIVSDKGAIGIGQLLPPTAQWVADDLIGVPGLDLYNTDHNIRVSARFLRWLITFHGGEALAIAGYYQGPTSVASKGLFPQTEAYVAAVQGGRWRFQSS